MQPIVIVVCMLGAVGTGFSQSAPKPAKALRIAVVQQDGNPGEVDAIKKKALGLAAKALAQKADVILFHEELLVGYVQNLKELAEPADGPTTNAFQKLLSGQRHKYDDVSVCLLDGICHSRVVPHDNATKEPVFNSPLRSRAQ